MSRTYRLRHCKSRVADRFIDGNATVHAGQIKTSMSYIIAHLIFGFPCKHTIQDEIKYSDRTQSWQTTHIVCIDHTGCMPLAGFTSRTLWSSTHIYWSEQYLKLTAGKPMYKVANIYRHEYAKPGRLRHKYGYGGSTAESRHFHEKRTRRRSNVEVAHMTKTGDYDI